jgi:phosphatidylserine/phosphatidylglycerophosphate/cardiolipin synthase-like enzyme
MADFLTTTGISYRLEEIIKTARERLILISPYLKINARIRALLEDRDRLKVDVRVVYGKSELQPEEIGWLDSVTSIRTSFCKNLHAKCYLNENQALLTSMNLYEFSQLNNDEMGLLVSREEEPELFAKIHEEAMRLVRASEAVRITVARVEATDSDEELTAVRRDRQSVAVEKPQRGFCIRCKSDVSANPAKPYCNRCFASWNRYKNTAYEEEHCHICGSEIKASLEKPLCTSCYRKHKDVFEFAT